MVGFSRKRIWIRYGVERLQRDLDIESSRACGRIRGSIQRGIHFSLPQEAYNLNATVPGVILRQVKLPRCGWLDRLAHIYIIDGRFAPVFF